jgi:hypothetical protein
MASAPAVAATQMIVSKILRTRGYRTTSTGANPLMGVGLPELAFVRQC